VIGRTNFFTGERGESLQVCPITNHRGGSRSGAYFFPRKVVQKGRTADAPRFIGAGVLRGKQNKSKNVLSRPSNRKRGTASSLQFCAIGRRKQRSGAALRHIPNSRGKKNEIGKQRHAGHHRDKKKRRRIKKRRAARGSLTSVLKIVPMKIR